MQVTRFISKSKVSASCYLVENNNECIIVDPCVSYDDIFKDDSKKLVGVFLTHGHFDHILEINSYLDKNVKIYMHSDAYEKIDDPYKNCSFFVGEDIRCNIDRNKIIFISEGLAINLLDKEITFIETPGHTNCSICILIDNVMFSGDMLFLGSVGRYDLYSSEYNKLMESIEKLKKVGKNYIVYPGHGRSTKLEDEIKDNPYFR